MGGAGDGVALGPLQHLLGTARPQGAGAGLQGVDDAVIADAVHALLAVLAQALACGLRSGGHLPPCELICTGTAHSNMLTVAKATARFRAASCDTIGRPAA